MQVWRKNNGRRQKHKVFEDHVVFKLSYLASAFFIQSHWGCRGHDAGRTEFFFTLI